MAIAAFWFSLMSLLVRVAGDRLPSQQVVLARGAVTALLTWAMVRRAGIPLRGGRERLLWLRAALGFAALSCFYYALIHLPLAEATTIQYTVPTWTALLAVWVLGERMGRGEVGLVLASLGGVLLVARPGLLFGGASGGLDPFAVAVALLGALFSAGAYVTVRKLSETEHPLTIVLYFSVFTFFAAMPGALRHVVVPTATEWLALLGVGVAGQAGQIYLTRGLKRERAGRATAVGYLQIVFAAAWGALVLREFPDAAALLGAVLIVGSTVALGRRAPAAEA